MNLDENTKEYSVVKDQQTELEFEMLSLFSEEQKQTYKSNFIDAAKKTGEIQ